MVGVWCIHEAAESRRASNDPCARTLGSGRCDPAAAGPDCRGGYVHKPTLRRPTDPVPPFADGVCRKARTDLSLLRYVCSATYPLERPNDRGCRENESDRALDVSR